MYSKNLFFGKRYYFLGMRRWHGSLYFTRNRLVGVFGCNYGAMRMPMSFNVSVRDGIRNIHHSPRLDKRRIKHLDPLPKPEEKFYIDDEIVPQSRMTDFLRFIGGNADKIAESEDFIENTKEPEIEYVVNQVIQIGRHTKILPGGRLMSFSALVMVGTGIGTAGIGRARGETVSQAIVNATTMAKKNMICIDRYRGVTITNDDVYKYKQTRIFVKACRTGYGIRASPEMRLVLSAFGLSDICMGMVNKTKNKHALYRAIFLGFQNGISLPEVVSKNLGQKAFDVKAFHYNSDE